jgi:hypothetical protein
VKHTAIQLLHANGRQGARARGRTGSHDSGARKSPAHPPNDRRSDTDRARRRAVQQGVPQPDRARKDEADAGHRGLARGAPRRRRRPPPHRRVRERAPSLGSAARARGGAERAVRVRSRRPGVRRGPHARPGSAREGARAPRPHRRRLGPATGGRAEGRRGAAHRGQDAFGGRAVLGHRARGRPLPARRLSLPALQHLHGDRALRRRARARGCQTTFSVPRSSVGAPAATAVSATGRRRARTSSARSSSPRG